MHPVLKRNFEIFPALDSLAALTTHIPNQGEHVVRYDGWDRTVSRGKWKMAQEQGQAPGPEVIGEVPPPPLLARPQAAVGPVYQEGLSGGSPAVPAVWGGSAEYRLH